MPEFRIREAPSPRGVVVSERAARMLASTKRFELRCEYDKTDELTAAIDTNAALPAHLDDDGVVTIGTVVEIGMLLVGRLTPSKARRPDDERAVDDALGISPMRDSSLRCPPDVDGRVVDVRRLSARAKERAAIEISIDADRPLVIGDVLELDGRREVVAAIAALGDDDLAWPGATGTHEVHRVDTAVDLLAARHIGPYSIVTQQPLPAKAQTGGQRVTAAQLRALTSRGGSWLAHEMMTVKSDDVPGRAALFESIVRGAPECRRIDPRSARILEAELRALGFDVDLDADAVAIGLVDTDAIRERMPGVVTKPETLNYRTFLPERQGLFCEDIFGSLGSADRGTRLGRIDFPAPCVHSWAIPAIAALFGWPVTDVDAVLAGQRTLAGDPPESWRATGGSAIQAGLAALDLFALADSSGDRGEIARRFVAAGRHPRLLCFESWPVLPPDLRPLVPLDGGRWATSDLNDLYRRLINRSNRTRRLVELGAPDVIVINELRMLQEALDSLVENGFRDRATTGPDHRRLMSLADMLQGERGRLASNAGGKRVDYSATGSVVPATDLPADRIRVPRLAALALFTPFVYAVLERQGFGTIKTCRDIVRARDLRAFAALDEVVRSRRLVVFAADADDEVVVALDIELWDESAFAMSAAALDALSIGPAGRVIVHVPIDPRAVDEARRLGASARELADERGGWISRAAHAPRVAPVLFDAALDREVDPVADALARTILARRVQ